MKAIVLILGSLLTISAAFAENEPYIGNSNDSASAAIDSGMGDRIRKNNLIIRHLLASIKGRIESINKNMADIDSFVANKEEYKVCMILESLNGDINDAKKKISESEKGVDISDYEKELSAATLVYQKNSQIVKEKKIICP